MNLDISPLEKAIAQVDDALELYSSDLAASNERLKLHLRAASIQAFEFTYELTIKYLRRYLELSESSPGKTDSMSFFDLIRQGYEVGLIEAELVEWKLFRQQRGTTSHTYNEDKAQEIFCAIPNFLKESKFLARELKSRQDTLS